MTWTGTNPSGLTLQAFDSGADLGEPKERAVLSRESAIGEIGSTMLARQIHGGAFQESFRTYPQSGELNCL